MEEKLKKALCFAIAMFPFVLYVTVCAVFGFANTIRTTFVVAVGIAIIAGAIYVARACALELYERVFCQDAQSQGKERR